MKNRGNNLSLLTLKQERKVKFECSNQGLERQTRNDQGTNEQNNLVTCQNAKHVEGSLKVIVGQHLAQGTKSSSWR